MDVLMVSALLVLSASTVPGWRVPAQQPQRPVFPFVQPGVGFPPPPPNNDQLWGVSNTNPGRQTFPGSQPNTDPAWGVSNTNPGRQTFPGSQPNTDPAWGVSNTNPGRQTFPGSQPNTNPGRPTFPGSQPNTNPGRPTFPGSQPNTNPGRQTFPGSQPNTDPWWVQNTNPGRQTFPQQPSIFPQPILDQFGNPQQGGQCQSLAKAGDCKFYDCFKQVEQQCLSQGPFLVNDMQSLCQGAQQFIGSLSFQGQQYLQKVSQCGARQMTNVLNSQNCNDIDIQAATTLFGLATSEDCYWQNQQLCDVVANPQDSQTLVAILFGGNAPVNPQFIRVAEHLQFLVRRCPLSVQNTFQENFINRCPAGTVGRQNQPAVRPTQPMMMMNGAGGD